MYMDDDTMTPRDRISDDMLKRMLDSEAVTPSPSVPCRPDGQEHSWGLRGYPLASVYAPLQEFHKLYDRQAALQKGTVFTELDLPFMGASVAKGGTHRG